MNVHSVNSRRRQRAARPRPRPKNAAGRTGPGRPPTGGKREDILDAALSLFAGRGFYGTAIPDIAALAGVATGTLYAHFAHKEHIVNEVYRHAKRILADAIRDVPTSGPLRERFHALWWRLVWFARHEPQAFGFVELHHHHSYLDRESRLLELQILAPIAAVLEGGRTDGTIKPLPVQALMVTVWGAFVTMIKSADAGYYKLTDELCEQIEAMCWDAIAA